MRPDFLAAGFPDDRCLVMGVLNVTPDSFWDGGRYVSADAAVARAVTLAHEGADIIDVGGESTRPGAAPVSEHEELARVIPVIERLRRELDRPVSIDTSKPGVMRAAVAAGAAMINDVHALRRPGALQAAAGLGVPVCLMHMQGEPGTMQAAPQYRDVVAEVCAFLRQRASACIAAGIDRRRLVLDPGFGFGKTLQHNLELLRRLRELVALGFPVLAGLSRKTMIGQLLGQPEDRRLFGSVALAMIARQQGARIIRVHDVAETVEVLKVADAVAGLRPAETACA